MANKFTTFAAALACSVMPGYALAQTAPAVPAAPGKPATPAGASAQAKQAPVPVDVFNLKQAPSAAVTESRRNIDNLQVLKSRIALAEARAKLAAAERDVHGAKSDAIQPVKTLPKVISVMGQLDNLSAQIVFAGGTIRNIKKGDRVGPMNVAHVNMHEVIDQSMPQRLKKGLRSPQSLLSLLCLPGGCCGPILTARVGFCLGTFEV